MYELFPFECSKKGNMRNLFISLFHFLGKFELSAACMGSQIPFILAHITSVGIYTTH